MDNVVFVPSLTTLAGSCLTAENWREVGVKIASFSLESLLTKPGLVHLNSLNNLGQFTGWQGATVLNASMPKLSRRGVYELCSNYDGSKIECSLDDLLKLCQQLKPEHLILPKQATVASLPLFSETTLPYIPIENYPDIEPQQRHGIYISSDHNTDDLLAKLDKLPHVPCYFAWQLDSKLLATLSNNRIVYFQSDAPAADAFVGKVYCDEGVISLDDKKFAEQFKTLSSDCDCPTCKQLFTRAYLHHLLGNTPLLCQRFLIQHNVFAMKILL